jgi:hypothetical protein
MDIGIKVVVKAAESKYDMSLEIPTTSPTADQPFKFAVKEVKGDDTSDVLLVAVGGSDKICVRVKPPQSLISLTGTDVFDELQAVVEEGTYDADAGKFITG